MTDLPAPLTPPDCDLQDFPRMMQLLGTLEVEQRGMMPRVRRQRLHSEIRRLRLLIARCRASHTDVEWLDLLREFDGACARCGSKDHVQKDHIILIARGGSDGIDNLQPLCRACNAGKGLDQTNWVEIRRLERAA